MHDIARNLKRLRRQKGLTQEELADKLHVTRQAVSNWERNQNLPELEVLLAAAEAMGGERGRAALRPAAGGAARRAGKPAEKGHYRCCAVGHLGGCADVSSDLGPVSS